ncbi:MAG: PilZ domain-containing protein [Pseudomonas sp.]
MTTRDDADRREYYRIDDRIALQISPLDPAQAEADGVLQDSSTLFNLLSELHLADFESQHLLRQISESDRNMASYLKVINKRIDLLAQALAQSLLHDIGQPRAVSLSEDGIHFTNPQALVVGSHLALKMVLMPQALGLLLRAEVLYCNPSADQQFEIGTHFEALTDAQRQLLARHILHKQARQRREALEGEQPISAIQLQEQP